MAMHREGDQEPRQKKKQRRLTTLIVLAGIANSVHEAQEMLVAGEICMEESHGSGKRRDEDPRNVGTLMLDEDTRVIHRSKCPECRSKPLVFTKRDKKPAISSTTHALVEEGAGRHYDLPSSGSTRICQEDLEAWIYRRRQFAELDEPIAIALSKGATVEEGVHTAELVADRAENGSVHLKLVIR